MQKQVIQIPNILLPKNAQDSGFMNKWSVIACDQFTSDRGYWQTLDRLVGDTPSTLRMVFPEVYLKDEGGEERVDAINATMQKYLCDGLFQKLDKGFILTARETKFTKEIRYGIVLAVDLESYSFAPQSNAQIRATEATVPERIPPRVKIRQGAKLELPHVMLLYNAKEEEVLGGTLQNLESLVSVYDFELNQEGGRLKGWFLDETRSKKIMEKLYVTAGEMLFAVGDGNHSLATAKTCWENIKVDLSEAERKNHPARFALCEAVSIYSPALTFEPIHRFVSGVDSQKLTERIQKEIPFTVKKDGRVLSFEGDYDVAKTLRCLDAVIAEQIKEGGEVDYIHGERELYQLVNEGLDRVGILLKAIPKDGFFASVERGGSLPRKTFSMGEGVEKRYYTECKEI